MKKLFFIVLPLLLILVIGGVLYWHYITSPEYSLGKIKESITNHDITSFEKYVDVDGIIMRMMSQIPQVIGADKKLGLFGKDVDQLILSALQGPIINIAKESVRTVIERGYFDQQVTQTDSISKLFKQLPIDSFKIMALKKIRKKGKICMVPLQIYVEAYDGETTLELMMRDKGSFWQVAEISNLPKVMYDIAQLQKTYPYRNRYAAVLYMANSIKEANDKAFALSNIATELARAGKIQKAIETANSIKDLSFKESALSNIGTVLAKTGKIQKAIETINLIKRESYKAMALSDIATELAKAGKIQKAIEAANSQQNTFVRAGCFADIATGLVKTGKIQKAVETASSIKRATYGKVTAFAEIATALEMAGKTQEAERFILEAIETANSIKKAYPKALALSKLATELGKARKWQEAERFISEAIETANSIRKASLKALALHIVANELAKLPIDDKQEDAKVANLIMTALNQ